VSGIAALPLHSSFFFPFPPLLSEDFHATTVHDLRLHAMSRGAFGRPHSRGVSSAPPIRRCTFTSDQRASTKALSSSDNRHHGSSQTLAPGADRHGGRGMWYRKDIDIFGSNRRSLWRKSVHCTSDGSTPPGRKVGTRSFSDHTGVARLPD